MTARSREDTINVGTPVAPDLVRFSQVLLPPGTAPLVNTQPHG